MISVFHNLDENIAVGDGLHSTVYDHLAMSRCMTCCVVIRCSSDFASTFGILIMQNHKLLKHTQIGNLKSRVVKPILVGMTDNRMPPQTGIHTAAKSKRQTLTQTSFART